METEAVNFYRVGDGVPDIPLIKFCFGGEFVIGVYIHIPFCKSKCPYCDFYSLRYTDGIMDRYLSAVVDDIKETAKNVSEEIDTVYFGGGTPSVFGGERIAEILKVIRECYNLSNPEITVECNPSTTNSVFYETISVAGVNRISLGMQSAVDKERKSLGRIADKKQIAESIAQARKAGISNISLDMMLGVPYQTIFSIDESINFIKEQNVEHISAYMLKIEEGTYFHKNIRKLSLPDDDTVCDMYLHFSERMKDLGYDHYEISNFAKEGKQSKHNTKYWHDEEYIGFGPSAYSFYKGKRYHYDADIEKYISCRDFVSDETGGYKDEYIMLALRLSEGLIFEHFINRYNCGLPESFFEKADKFAERGLLISDDKHIALTTEGFLLSNTIIGDLIDELD